MCGNDFSIADAAIFPFIRQLAGVDSDWFRASVYLALNKWLEAILATELFGQVMAK